MLAIKQIFYLLQAAWLSKHCLSWNCSGSPRVQL